MAKHGLWIGAVMGLLAVTSGTFGAHGLESMLGELEAAEMAKRKETWEIGGRYLMYHAIVVFIVGMLGQELQIQGAIRIDGDGGQRAAQRDRQVVHGRPHRLVRRLDGLSA